MRLNATLVHQWNINNNLGKLVKINQQSTNHFFKKIYKLGLLFDEIRGYVKVCFFIEYSVGLLLYDCLVKRNQGSNNFAEAFLIYFSPTNNSWLVTSTSSSVITSSLPLGPNRFQQHCV